MSRKHFFSSPEGVVVHMLNSLVSRNPSMGLDEAHRVVYSKTHPPSQVTIISGGGSGHEPAWSGFVGDGMLSAAVCGDIFASPSTKQIMAGIRSVPSDAGIILCITNYTGDMLHFGLAREKGAALGYKIDVVSMAEDAALGRKKSEKVGRRGLAGNLLVIKLIGAASVKAWSFEQCLKLGQLGNSQLVTIGTSLDHCHVPGREAFEQVQEDACVLGMGIHNEPGLRTITPMPSAEDVVKEMLKYLLDQSDSDRAFVKFDPDDEVVMLINNFGGLSGLELEALTNVSLVVLKRDWKITPIRIYAGIMETSLNGQGFSITLGNITGIARAMSLQTSDIVKLLDAPTTAPAWPKNGFAPFIPSAETQALREKVNAQAASGSTGNKGPSTPPGLIKALTKACKTGLAAEPQITQYDLQMGDGDCGEAVAGVCKSILSNITSLSTLPPLLTLLESIGENVEDVGGSLGAILSILVTAFTNALHDLTINSDRPLDISTVSEAGVRALRNLENYTSAREGDRTVMDVLIPFIRSLAETKDFGKSVVVAKEKADETKNMKAKFGRATYVGEEMGAERSQVPDPGAYAAGVWLGGLEEGLKG